MTPVIFVSFLFSLAWVEFRYSMLRSHEHGERPPSLNTGSKKTNNGNGSSTSSTAASVDECNQHRIPMPSWLHSIVYRRQPYHYVLVKGSDSPPATATGRPRATTAAKTTKPAKNDNSYYHSMQRKLLKMESDEAFRIRTTVLWVMGFAAVGSVWMATTAVRCVVAYLRG